MAATLEQSCCDQTAVGPQQQHEQGGCCISAHACSKWAAEVSHCIYLYSWVCACLTALLHYAYSLYTSSSSDSGFCFTIWQGEACPLLPGVLLAAVVVLQQGINTAQQPELSYLVAAALPFHPCATGLTRQPL